jgi:hypothetical protein
MAGVPPIFPPDSPGPPHPVHQPQPPGVHDASAAPLDGQNAARSPDQSSQDPNGSDIPRDKPEPDEKRRKLVADWGSKVKKAKTKWEKVFKKMIRDQKFCAGAQWPEETKIAAFNDDFNDLYVANITLRHVKQRVAAVYAKNPKVIAKIRPRILSTVWDGTIQGLNDAQKTLQMQQAAMEARQKLGMGLGLGVAMAQNPGLAGGPPGAGGSNPAAGEPPGPPPGAGGGGPLATLSGKPEFNWQAPTAGTPPGAPGAPNPAASLMSMLSPQPGQQPLFPLPPEVPPDELSQAQAVIQDAKNVKTQFDMLKRIGRTLEILFTYEISQQQTSFKSRMKMTCRRAATSGVGWVKVSFQRIMAPQPDADSVLGDSQTQLQFVQRVTADLADGVLTLDDPQVEQMRLVIQNLGQAQEIVMREGLTFSWPKSTALIPDEDCVTLRDFLGCNWVAEEYCLTPDEIQSTYKVDVGKNYTSYDRNDAGKDYQTPAFRNQDMPGSGQAQQGCALVWEIFNKDDGLVYVVCDGYPDFLREPSEPEFYTDRFWPWFLIAFNETDGDVWPQSDVNLVRPMQLEINRSRQGLREHRFANRPKTAYAEGTLNNDDLDSLRNPPANALIAIQALQPGQNIDQVLQAIKGVPIDPNLYQTNETFQDMLRVAGDQQADLGPTSGATATESNIAAQARATSTGSEVDDIDDTLSSMAQSAGQILLLNMSQDQVKKIVGPGAIWPQLTKGDVAQQMFLDIEAGSSGSPDQARELQNFERLAPILMQIPGIAPNFLAKEAISRMDDSIDLEDAIADGQPSVMAQNAVQPGASAGPPGSQPPGAQGPQGGANAPKPPAPQSSAPTPNGASAGAAPPMTH